MKTTTEIGAGLLVVALLGMATVQAENPEQSKPGCEVCKLGLMAEDLNNRGAQAIQKLSQKGEEIRRGSRARVSSTCLRADSAEHGMGTFVLGELAKGKRGTALADSIHAELKKRGVGKGHGKPGGPDGLGKPDSLDKGKPAGVGKPDGLGRSKPAGAGPGK